MKIEVCTVKVQTSIFSRKIFGASVHNLANTKYIFGNDTGESILESGLVPCHSTKLRLVGCSRVKVKLDLEFQMRIMSTSLPASVFGIRRFNLQKIVAAIFIPMGCYF